MYIISKVPGELSRVWEFILKNGSLYEKMLCTIFEIYSGVNKENGRKSKYNSQWIHDKKLEVKLLILNSTLPIQKRLE